MESQPYFQAFQRILEGLPASSRNSYLKYFAECPADIQYSFLYDTVRSGWKKAGILPIDIVQILKKWPSFKNITADQAKDLIEIIEEEFIPLAREEGYIDDKILYDAISKVLPEVVKDELYERAREKLLPSAFNRWRCTWINKDGTLRRRKEIARNKLKTSKSKRKHSDDIQDEYSNMKKNDLKRACICSSKRLPVGGNIATLKERLRNTNVYVCTEGIEEDSIEE